MGNYLYCVEPIGPDDKAESKEGQSIRCVFFRPSPMGSFYDFYGEPFIFIFKKVCGSINEIINEIIY
jgi:hypothetical protein